MLRFLLISAAAVLSLNVLMFFQQPGMIFFPVTGLASTPADWGLDYEDVALESADGTGLRGWYIPRPGARKVVLFFHGNAGNISHRRDSVAVFNDLGLNVFIFDYRGYGLSEGEPSENGFFHDAYAAWRYLTVDRGFRAEDVIIFGRSLGGAVAANLASRVEAGGLILESTFSSARDAAALAFPLLSRLVLLRYDFDSAAALRQVHCPVLVLHSPYDEVIPYALGRTLFEAANEPKVFVDLHGDHNGGFMVSRPGYDQALRHFILDTLDSPVGIR